MNTSTIYVQSTVSLKLGAGSVPFAPSPFTPHLIFSAISIHTCYKKPHHVLYQDNKYPVWGERGQKSNFLSFLIEKDN